MRIFISGVDTGIGKTLISSWICLHTGYSYFKPIQTGNLDTTDTETVKSLSNCHTFPEAYSYKLPASPHVAAAQENDEIDISKIQIPNSENLIIEGAGGLMVPVNDKFMMIDLIKKFDVPVILVINPRLGAINHALLSIEALKNRGIKILGIIFSGDVYPGSYDIAKFGNVEILAEIHKMHDISQENLLKVRLGEKLENIFKI